MSIQRYDLGEVANYEGAEPRLEPGMVEDETGIYVLYSAHQSELAALREELANAKEWSDRLDKRCVALATDKDTMIDRCKAAERRNAELVECAEELADLVEASLEGDYRVDSFTTQPIRNALNALKSTESGASE